MKLPYACILLLGFGIVSIQAQDDALRQCGNLLHDDIHKLPNARGEFVNNNCLLKCYSGSVTLLSNEINEGFPCKPATGVSFHIN